MDLWVRALEALPKYLGSIPSMHIKLTSIIPVPGDLMFSYGL